MNRKPYVQLNQVVLDKQKTCIHKKTKMYIKNNILANKEYTDQNKIDEILSIGNYKNDKIICMFNVFYKCVKNNNISLIRQIINYYKKNETILDFIVNSYYSSGKTKYTPLMCAAYYGNIDIVKLLMENGADINVINDYNENIIEMTQIGLKNHIKKNPTNSTALITQYNIVIDYLTEIIKKSIKYD